MSSLQECYPECLLAFQAPARGPCQQANLTTRSAGCKHEFVSAARRHRRGARCAMQRTKMRTFVYVHLIMEHKSPMDRPPIDRPTDQPTEQVPGGLLIVCQTSYGHASAASSMHLA